MPQPMSEVLEALAPAGLALAVLAACVTLMRSSGEQLEWNTYLALGTVLPAGVLLIAAPLPRWQRARRLAALALGAAFAVASTVLIFGQPSLPAACFALVTVGVVAWHARRNAQDYWRTPAVLFVPVAFAAWIAAQRFLWWTPPAAWGWRSLTGGAVVAGLTAHQIFARHSTVNSIGRRAVVLAADAFAVALLLLASVRADRLFTPNALHHWSFIAGPAQLVREGGWLLWDVPSQYGFLSTLAIAALPARDVWQAIYLLDSALLFLSAAFVYLLLRTSSPGPLRQAFALLATLAAVFLVPGEVVTRSGPQEYPSIGALRFFWCYAMLAVLVWAHRDDTVPSHHRRILITGCAVWLAGTLWSFESAVYCAAIWLPAYALLVWRWTPRGGARTSRRIRACAAWWLLPAALLGAIVIGLHLTYVATLGNAPDWWAFAEYSASYAAGFAALPVQSGGPVGAIVLVFCALTAVVGCGLRGALPPAALAPAVGAWATVWATASYFVGRSADSSATNITSLLCVAALVALSLVRRADAASAPAMLARLLLVPFLSVVVIAGFAEPKSLGPFGTALLRGYSSRISDGLPRADGDLGRLFASAGVGADDAVIAISRFPVPAFDSSTTDAGRTRRPPGAAAWLPALPFALLTPIAESRRRTYVRRFLARRPVSGWLLVPKQPDELLGDVAWMDDELARTHDATRRFESAEWTLIRYDEHRRAPAVRAREERAR